ncbi:HAD family hydrolase [Gymnodinialimonas sp. 2305UL16-5]|uniref:HAD family hydrolase n=1 Tax=Gymnodinialimonas mytili TaxID=3126503 RepID=UPI00309B750F
MAIKGVLFDKDGVLFDFQASWGVGTWHTIQALAGGRADLAERLADCLDYDLEARRFHPSSFAIAGTAAEVADAIADVLTHRNRAEIQTFLDDAGAATEMVPAAPLADVFDALIDRGLPLGVATNDSEMAARQQIAGQGVFDRFAFIAGSDSGHGAKPAPGMCLAFAAETRLTPDECVMVGDSTHDLHAGRAAGFRTLGVLTGVATAAVLAPWADAVLPSIAELPDWLDQRG